MAKVNRSTASTRPRIPARSINEFVFNHGFWHPHIADVRVVPSDDGFKVPKIACDLVGPGTLAAKKLSPKVDYELGARQRPNGELQWTELTQLCFALGLLTEESLSEENYEATMASFDFSAAIGLAIRCQVVRRETTQTIGTVTVRQPFDQVVLSSIELDE